MSDAFSLALAEPGLGWLLLTISVAGIVRGFTGFGTAMIFMPVAVQFLPVAEAILIMAITGIGSSVALLPRAWRNGDRGEVASLALAAAILVPVGISITVWFDIIVLRWMVAGVIALTLAALLTGWRYQRRLGPAGRLSVGAGAGLVGGLTGMTGPVVIVFYLANARTTEAVRANVILFLASLDVVLIVSILMSKEISGTNLWVAGLLVLPYVSAAVIGQRLFDPARESLYRWAAYGVITIAVLSSLPLFD